MAEEVRRSFTLWRASRRRLAFELRWLLRERLMQSWAAEAARLMTKMARLPASGPALLLLLLFPRMLMNRARELAELCMNMPDLTVIIPLQTTRLAELTVREAAKRFAPIYVVVASRSDAERWRSRTGIEVVNIQDTWTDAATDLAVHEQTKALLARLEQETQRQGASCRDLLEMMYLHLHEFLVRQFRRLHTLDRLRALGASAVYFDMGLTYWDSRLLSAYLGSEVNFVTVSHRRFRLVDVCARSEHTRNAAVARERLEAVMREWPGDGLVRGAPKARDNAAARSPAFITDADVGSIYWQTFVNVEAAARKRWPEQQLLVSRASARRSLGRKRVRTARLPTATFCDDPGEFRNAYADLRKVCESLSKARDIGDGKVHAAVQALDAWLANTGVFTSIAYRSVRLDGQMRYWLRATGTGAVVAIPHWSTNGWVALRAARKIGVPTVSAPAVTIAGNTASLIRWDILDLIGSYGTQCTDALKETGIGPGRIAEVGNLSMDHLKGLAADRLDELGAVDFKVDTARKTVLVATGGLNSDEQAFLGALLDHKWAGTPPLIVIRPHPTLGVTGYRRLVEERSADAAVFNTRGGILPALVRADLVITDASTSGAQAVLLGKPLVVVNGTEQPFPANDYGRLGIAREVRTPGEIGPTVERILREGSFWPEFAESHGRFVEAYNIHDDGRAAQRMVEAIAAAMRSRPGNGRSEQPAGTLAVQSD